MIAENVLGSCRLPGNSALSFVPYIARNSEPDAGRIAMDSGRPLVLVTALPPRIAYDGAVKIAKPALADDSILKQAAEKLGIARPGHADRRGYAEELTRPGAPLPGGRD